MFNKKLKEDVRDLQARVRELDSPSYGKVGLLTRQLAQHVTKGVLDRRDDAFASAFTRQDAKIQHLEEQLSIAGKLLEGLNNRFLELGGILARRKIVDQRTNHTKQRRGRDRRAK